MKWMPIHLNEDRRQFWVIASKGNLEYRHNTSMPIHLLAMDESCVGLYVQRKGY